jgi:hypothetical protein
VKGANGIHLVAVEVSDSENNIIALINAIRSFLTELDDTYLKVFLADWPTANFRTRSIVPHTLPVLSWMPEAVNAAGKKGEFIVKMLASVANQITWGQTYSADDFGPGFLDKYGWTELIGQRGPFFSDRIACGFLILGPQIEYPRHCHGAEEVYVPLTRQTLWQQGQQTWACREPHLPIYHAPGVMHAMRTETVPLLALYLWRGANLTEKSHIE